MKRLSLASGVLLASALALIPDLASAASLSPSVILSNPQSYDGRSVSVTGTVRKFTTRETRRGAVSLFQLCDRKCIGAVDMSGGAETDGSTATISGTFHASFHTRRKTFTNIIVIGGGL